MDLFRAVAVAVVVLVVALPAIGVWLMVRTHRRYDRWDRR